MALRNLVAEGKLPYPSLIFVQSVQRAEELHNTLVLDGLRVESVHGNRTASQRDAAVAAFRKGEVFMLVVTEVLARGMDFRGVKVVVNYGELLAHYLPSAPPFLLRAPRKEPSCETHSSCSSRRCMWLSAKSPVPLHRQLAGY